MNISVQELLVPFGILTHLRRLHTMTLTYYRTKRSTYINKQHQAQRQNMYTGTTGYVIQSQSLVYM